MEEIKLVVWGCSSDKTPGLNGYTFKLIKKNWCIMKDDIIRYIKHFETSGSISQGYNSSFILLIPKTKDPTMLGDYRPISLIGCIYKIISKKKFQLIEECHWHKCE